jgi:hypothetical protein
MGKMPTPPDAGETPALPRVNTYEDWQVKLRRQFGREQPFVMENLGDQPFFSEFAVSNPQSGGRYRVAIRGTGLGESRFRHQ